MKSTYLFITVGLAAAVAVLLLANGPLAVQATTTFQDKLTAPQPEPQSNNTCFATIDEVTVHSSSDSQAVRDAVAAASDGDLVKVAGYCAGVETINGIEALVYISENITVRGGYTTTGWTYDPGTYTTTLDAMRAGRVVYIAGMSSPTLDSLYIISGTTPSDECGGGIHVAADAAPTVAHSTVFSNTSPYAGGGICVAEDAMATIAYSTVRNNRVINPGEEDAVGSGIVVGPRSKVTVTHCLVRDNWAEGGGGVLSSWGTTTFITHSTIRHNHATNMGGGLILNLGRVNVSHSTIDGNTAGTDGGGIANLWGVVVFTNTTVSGNQAARGGGIANLQSTASLNADRAGSHTVPSGGVITPPPDRERATFLFCTVTANQAVNGGGIANVGATVVLSSTIVADQVSGVDCSGGITSQGNNLDSDSTCGLSVAKDDIGGGDARLGPLQLNDPGDTATHALAHDSDAIDAIFCAYPTVPYDQRGVSRPQGTACDIGAYEFAARPAIAVLKTANVITATVGDAITYTYRLINPGNTPLTNVRASDDKLGTIALVKSTLAPDEATLGTAVYSVVTADLPGPLTNTVTVTGAPPLGTDVTASDDTSVTLYLLQSRHLVFLPAILKDYQP